MESVSTEQQSDRSIVIYMRGEYIRTSPKHGDVYRIDGTVMFLIDWDYHKSYNKLMPVISKLMADLESVEGGKGHDLQCSIRHKLQATYKDITPVCDLVVEGIEYVNHIKLINHG